VSVAEAIRKEQNQSFTRFTNEITEATRAVDEALDSIKQMMAQSFIEVDREDQ
jgi:hypothetical protein